MKLASFLRRLSRQGALDEGTQEPPKKKVKITEEEPPPKPVNEILYDMPDPGVALADGTVYAYESVTFEKKPKRAFQAQCSSFCKDLHWYVIYASIY